MNLMSSVNRLLQIINGSDEPVKFCSEAVTKLFMCVPKNLNGKEHAERIGLTLSLYGQDTRSQQLLQIARSIPEKHSNILLLILLIADMKSLLQAKGPKRDPLGKPIQSILSTIPTLVPYGQRSAPPAITPVSTNSLLSQNVDNKTDEEMTFEKFIKLRFSDVRSNDIKMLEHSATSRFIQQLLCGCRTEFTDIINKKIYQIAEVRFEYHTYSSTKCLLNKFIEIGNTRISLMYLLRGDALSYEIRRHLTKFDAYVSILNENSPAALLTKIRPFHQVFQWLTRLLSLPSFTELHRELIMSSQTHFKSDLSMRLWAAAFQEFARPIYSLAFLSDVDKDPIFQTVFEPIQFDVAAAGRLLRLLREAVPSHPLFDLADEYMERFLKLENCVEEYQKKCQQSILNIENKWNEYHKDNFNQRMKEFEMEKFEIRDRLHQTEMILLLKMKENMKEKQERLAILQKEIDTFDKLRRKKEAEEKQENKEYIDNLVANKAVTPIFRPMSTEEQIMVEREKLDLFMEFRQQMIDLGASEEHIMSFFPDLNLPENELEALGINYHSDESIYEEEEEKETFFKLLIDEEAKNDSKVEIKENQNIEKSEIEQKENYFQDMKHSKEESKEDIKEIFRPKIRRPNFYGKDDDSKPTTFEEFMEDEKKRKESRPKTFAEFVEDERKRNEDKPKTFDEFIEDEQRRGLRTGPLKSQKNEEKIDNTIVIGQEIQEELQDLAELNLGIDDEEEEEDDRKQIKKYTKCAQNLDDDDDSLMETQMITRPKVRFQQNIIDEASRTNQRNTNRNLNNDNNRESSQNINITNTQNISDNVASHDPNDNQDSNNNDNINPTPQNANQEQDNHDNNPNNSSINHKNEDNDDEIVVNAPPLKTIPALFHRLVIPSFKIHYRVVSMALFSIFKSRNEFQRQITALSKTFLITACSETDEFVKLFSDIPYGPGSFIRIGKSFANIATNLNFDGTIQIGTASEPPTSVADIIERINVMPVEVKPNPIFNLLLTSSIIQCYISMFRVILMLKLARAAVDKMWFLTRDSYMHRPDSRASALMLRFVTCTETYFHATALAPAAKALEQVCEGVETIEECNKKHEDILRNLLTMSLLNPNTKAIRTPLLQSLVEICKYVYEPLISGKKVSIDDFEDSAGKFALILHELNSAISENEMFRFLDTLFADFMIR